jgi:hypothetical protein
MDQKQTEAELSDKEENPPVLKSWNNIYLVVLLNLVILIIFFFIFSKVFE